MTNAHATNGLYNVIDEELKLAVPKSKPRVVDRNNPWWNENLSRQKKKHTRYSNERADFLATEAI